MKINTYPTLQRAQYKLDLFYYKNAMIVYGLYDQLQGISSNFERKLQKASKEQAAILTQELVEAMAQLGRGEQLTAPLKLYNCNRGYGLEICYLGGETDVMDGFFTSIDDLANAVQDRMHRSSFSAFGVTETPFLYTITEPFHFSEEEKKKARAMHKYDQLNPAQQSDIDATLDAYVEYGLGPEERQKFEKKYLKFFN